MPEITSKADHHCHAHGCKRSVPPRMLMCAKHWRMVHPRLQREVWRFYRPGQEIDKNPSHAYMLVQRACVWQVFVDEGSCTFQNVPEIGSKEYMIGPDCLRKDLFS